MKQSVAAGRGGIFFLAALVVFFGCPELCFGSAGSCASPLHGDDAHAHHHHPHDHHACDQHHHHRHDHSLSKSTLPEELAEEEDMKLYGFDNLYSQDHHHDLSLSGLGLWLHSLGCSLLVSLASLVCLIILPLVFTQGKISKEVVDTLALFGAGAMLGDAFLHQLPHAFGGEHSDLHDHGDHSQVGRNSHSHSLKDLSVGLSILAGIVLFLLVEKVVRYVENNSTETNAWSHGHRHHLHKSSGKLKDAYEVHEKSQPHSSKECGAKGSEDVSDNSVNGVNMTQDASLLCKRNTMFDNTDDETDRDASRNSSDSIKSLNKKDTDFHPSSLVFGYLNLVSDGVHNFTDGMALGSAFLVYGSVGGWSRTLFLLAHELPQEVGDFGILVRSGFSVSEALFFNFLSALVALAGTALALLWGQDPGQSAIIEGFTAGGFIYIAVAGVLAEMNSSNSTLRNTVVQVTSLVLGMSVALCISLAE
ncbi:hypothetical protein K2173_021331 [Erythroxylum novogranatense]|uniref:IAA-alanine resistance protein 1 n=1 Tax=Erythroxylum novogranatense TaxID=1862640 RepID=A0AAV8TXS4_9ROSI|nr:hypothetical protein K2173_021331 [Erythroxylum novogranatense]